MTNTPRKLGNSTLEVGRIGLGCMGMSEFYGGTRDEAAHIATLRAAVDLGVRHFDTADMYGLGHNEELLGRAFADRWDQVTVASKFGVQRTDDGQWLGISGRPEYVQEACEKSLTRLGLETLDLYYMHRPDPDVPVEESVGAMKELVEEGKVRYLGLSEFSAEQIRAAHAVHPIAALQTEYSLWSREVETDGVLETCRDLGIGLVPYSPLGRGFLTGQIASRDDLDESDYRLNSPRFSEENMARNLALAQHVIELAASRQVTPAQLALGWVLARGEDITAIPGTKHIRYLEENAVAINIGFSEEELAEIDALFPVGVAAGSRY